VNLQIALAEARALLRCDIPKIKTRAAATPLSWERFLAAVAELKNWVRLLRSRVLLGARVRRGLNTKRKPLRKK